LCTGNGAYTPPIATTAAMLSFSQSLLKQRLTAKESRYGALMFDQDLSKGVVFTNLTAYQVCCGFHNCSISLIF
jgi:hypothetical protein